VSLTVLISKVRNLKGQRRFAVKMTDSEGRNAMLVCPTKSHAKEVTRMARKADREGKLWQDESRIIIP
jgi:hypothetical protein